jgi:hypothetical protein
MIRWVNLQWAATYGTVARIARRIPPKAFMLDAENQVKMLSYAAEQPLISREIAPHDEIWSRSHI